MQLNDSEGKYKKFYGKNTEQMPLLIAEGRVPMSTAQLMQRRLELRNSDEDLKSAWLDNYFDTGDTVAYYTDSRIKINLDSQTLREMTPDSPRNSGALVLTEDVYNALEGEEFKKDQYGKIDKHLSKKEAKNHPIWIALARDQNLLNDYVDLIFTEAKERFSYNKNMEVFLGSAKGNTPKMRAWFVYKLNLMSSASGGELLDYSDGRLVGLAPETQSAAKI